MIMEPIISSKPFIAVLISFLAVFVLLSCRTKNIREAWTFIAATL